MRKKFVPYIEANTVSLEHYHYSKPQRKHSILRLTRRTAMVPLQHHRTPPENSEGMLFLLRTCLKSDNFSSFINAVWWPATCNSRMWKLQLLLNTHTSYRIPVQISDYFQSGNRSVLRYNNSEHAASRVYYGSLYLCSGKIMLKNQAHLFFSSPIVTLWSQLISLDNSMLTHTPETNDPFQAQSKLTFLHTIVWQ
jgi:hypothetical protein